MRNKLRILQKDGGFMTSCSRKLERTFWTAAMAVLLLIGAPAAFAANPISGLSPLANQPDATKIMPGLAVTYYFNIFNYVKEISQFAEIEKGVPGKPIPMLNYKVGPGKVLTSASEES